MLKLKFLAFSFVDIQPCHLVIDEHDWKDSGKPFPAESVVMLSAIVSDSLISKGKIAELAKKDCGYDVNSSNPKVNSTHRSIVL